MLTAWYDSSGRENADKCAWNYVTSATAPNGALYNVALGGRNWRLQSNWVNSQGGYCGLSGSKVSHRVTPCAGDAFEARVTTRESLSSSQRASPIHCSCHQCCSMQPSETLGTSASRFSLSVVSNAKY